MKKTVLSLAVATLISALPKPASAFFEAWDSANDPYRFLSRVESNINSLPTSGSVRQPLWSDTYWPHREGGAAYRWQTADGNQRTTNPHYYGVYRAEQLARMTDAQIALLSPAEKFDIAQGRFDYPTVRKEIARTRPSDEKWYGLCHAVAFVSTLFQEPETKTMSSRFPDGSVRNITFYSSDIKALMALSANKAIDASVGLGQRCNSLDESSQACWDTNPGSFFIAITNSVGLERNSIILDVDRGLEVWNASVKSYTATVTRKAGIGARAAYGTTREVRVDMNVQHTIGAKPSKSQVGGKFKTVTYSFNLELDAYDRIIGGEWISTNRPDMLWKANGRVQMDPEFNYLYYLTQPNR